MISFDLAVNYILRGEGVLEDDPSDAGGITKYGISLRFLKSVEVDNLKKYGIGDLVDADTIRNLTIDQAKSVYQGEFWNHAPFAQLGQQDVANYIFDMAVNEGIAPAIKCAQRATWAVMKQRGIIEDDGILGNDTISLINQCYPYILPAMRSERAGYYRLTALAKPNDEKYLSGWLNRAYRP